MGKVRKKKIRSWNGRISTISHVKLILGQQSVLKLLSIELSYIYNISQAHVLTISLEATIVKILMYALLCLLNMMCAVSIQLQVPVELSREVSNPSTLFFCCIPTFWSSNWKVNVLNNAWFEKKRMWFFLALKLMIPHPQPRCALWLEKNKVIFLTLCEALRRRGQFFRTVNIVVNNILSVNMSKWCCSIEKACYIGACIGPGRP